MQPSWLHKCGAQTRPDDGCDMLQDEHEDWPGCVILCDTPMPDIYICSLDSLCVVVA